MDTALDFQKNPTYDYIPSRLTIFIKGLWRLIINLFRLASSLITKSKAVIKSNDFLLLSSFSTLTIILTIIIKLFIINPGVSKLFQIEVVSKAEYFSNLKPNPIEQYYNSHSTASNSINTAIAGSKELDSMELSSYIKSEDKRVKVLEDYFRDKNSVLSNFAKDFIDNAKNYNIQNWQLIPAIAIAETYGCRTDISDLQKNCWGWGGGPSRRVWFSSYESAIEIISREMIETYGNERLNAKDIQNTYCGRWCAEMGWQWAMRVNYYVSEINDYGEKYGLERTNEIYSF